MGKYALVLIGAVTAAALISACGGNDERTGETVNTTSSLADKVSIPWGPESIGKTEYLARANKVCRESWDSMLYSFARRFGGVTKGKTFDEATKGIFLPSIQFWFDDIAYLNAPPGDKPQVEDLLTAIQIAVYRGKEQLIFSPERLSAAFEESNRRARQYGLDSCVVRVTAFS